MDTRSQSSSSVTRVSVAEQNVRLLLTWSCEPEQSGAAAGPLSGAPAPLTCPLVLATQPPPCHLRRLLLSCAAGHDARPILRAQVRVSSHHCESSLTVLNGVTAPPGCRAGGDTSGSVVIRPGRPGGSFEGEAENSRKGWRSATRGPTWPT